MLRDRYSTLALLVLFLLLVFLVRAFLAMGADIPHTFHLFDILTVAGALVVLVKGGSSLQRGDWITALGLGTVIGVGMNFATLYSPYPFLEVVRNDIVQALVRGSFTTIATLGGLVIMRQGGPVQIHAACIEWVRSGRGILIGLVIGLPLAAMNVFAFQITQGQPIDWQNPLAALLDALQPGVMEEVTYRFALWGLFWLILRNSLPEQAVWLAGLLSMLVHNYSHFDDLFLQSPVMALGMGAVLALFWGVPPLILARRRGLESAMAFHWIQDAARFFSGF